MRVTIKTVAAWGDLVTKAGDGYGPVGYFMFMGWEKRSETPDGSHT